MVREQAKTGLIDSLFCYIGPNNIWARVDNDVVYDLSRICLATLEALIASSEVRLLLRDAVRFIDLGPGTGDKLASFVRAAGEVTRHDKLGILAIDINDILLRQLRFTLRSHGGTRLAVLSARASFDQLPAADSRFKLLSGRLKAGPTIMLILGNTFGNLNEDRLFASINRVLLPGDLLILSLEFASATGRQNAMDEVLGHYRESPTIRSLFSRSLTYLDGKIGPLAIDLATDDRRFSSQRGTKTVYAHANVDGKDVVTVYSNRYDLDALAQSVESRGYEHLHARHIMASEFFRYLVFRKC